MHLMLPPAMMRTPRKFPFLDRLTYLRVDQPGWAKHDELIRYFINYWKVLEHGKLVLGAIVQANSSLFQPGPVDSGAVVVFDYDGTTSPEDLTIMAHRLFALRTNEPANREEKRFADHLNDEYERSFGWHLPPGYGSAGCRMTTLYLPRKHMPGGYLQDKILPLCVDTDTGMAVMLPVKYWASSNSAS